MHSLLNIGKIRNIVKSGNFTEFWNLVDKNKYSFNKVLYLFNKLRSELELSPVGLLKDGKIDEKFVSKKQAKYFYSRAGEGGKEGKKWKKMADEFASKTDFSKIPEKVNERIISYTKDSSTVEVKDECKLGGGKICNQGDINALKITKIKENLERNNKIKYKLPNFDFEWGEAKRYPEFTEIGKINWIKLAKKGSDVFYSEIRNKLGNVDLDFDGLVEPKKQRFEIAFKNNTVEMPIAVKFSDNDYDLVAGNTRLAGLVKNNIDPKIWIIDISNI
jgi:hypothetical protein